MPLPNKLNITTFNSITYKAQKTWSTARQSAASFPFPKHCMMISFVTTTCSLDLKLITEYKDIYSHTCSLQTP